MSDLYIGAEEPGTVTHKIDTEQLTVGANTVQRARGQISGASALEIAVVKAAAPAAAAYGLAVRTPVLPLSSHFVVAANANEANVKASAGTLRGVSGFNVADYPVYLKFHDTAGSPTAGSGVVLTLAVQAGTSVNFFPPGGVVFATGIARSCVKDITDAGTTVTVAADAVFDIFYD